jgi:cysteine-S-conjugate beta-lyase
LICFDGCPGDKNHPSSMPIYQTSTFVQPSASVFGPYDYR